MLTAFGAAFLGALVGVAGQAWWTRRHDEVRQRAEQTAAARLIRTELQLAAASLVIALKADHFAVIEGLELDAWRRHGPALARLPSDTFDVVAQACTKLDSGARYARLIGLGQRRALLKPDAKITKLVGAAESTHDLVDLCDRAILALGPIAYPGEQLRPWPPADRFPPPER
jgi:hypothetical protein